MLPFMVFGCLLHRQASTADMSAVSQLLKNVHMVCITQWLLAGNSIDIKGSCMVGQAQLRIGGQYVL